MAEPITPRFEEDGTYIRYFGESLVHSRDNQRRDRFVRLLEGMGPLRYPFSFASLAVDAKSSATTFRDLEPATGHVYQAFLGVAPGIRVQVFHPFRIRQLQFDQKVSDIDEDQVAVITHGLSPYEAPKYNIWIPPNKNYPALIAQNATADLLGFPGGKSIIPRVIWIAKVYRIESIEPGQREVFDMLTKKKIPSKPVTFGGSIREIP